MSTPMPADGWVEVNGLRLHYLDWGGGTGLPPVLFLHGGSAHAHWWDFTIPYLRDRFRCVALDLRGHGGSDRSAGGDYGLAAHAGDVAAVVEALGLAGGGVVGHSFGGWVAMIYAGRAGAAVGALAILDSRPTIGVRSARMLEALRKLPHTRYATHAEAITRFRLLPAATSADAAVVAHVATHGIVRDADGTYLPRFDRRALAGAGAQDLTPHLRAARCPILAVRAAHSEIVDAAALTAFRTAVPSVELAEIADAHHHLMLDQPAAVAAVVGDFLARHLGAASA
ncbi:MAG TPA: alpha/beta hydrolase [Candidatus Dormibacteraeota bacterium]|nr:alpha/beta hydrolase [Candidatus Dormibacteraeota bacterium]